MARLSEKILTMVHFVTLIIAIVNALFKYMTKFSLEGNLELGVELTTVLSGLALFFFHLKPFKRISFYFSIYAITALLMVFGLVFRGLFFGLILSVILFPIVPDQKDYERDGIIISTPFQGLLAACCIYQVKERKLLIFEKACGTIVLEGEGPINFESITCQLSDKKIKITYSTKFDDQIVKAVVIQR